MGKKEEKINIKEFEYFLVFFSFNNDYDLAKKHKLLSYIIEKLVEYYFANTALSLSSNAIVVKQDKQSYSPKIEMHIENAIFDEDDNNYFTKDGLRIIENYEISYFVIPVDFKDVRKYLVNYNSNLLDFFEKL